MTAHISVMCNISHWLRRYDFHSYGYHDKGQVIFHNIFVIIGTQIVLYIETAHIVHI